MDGSERPVLVAAAFRNPFSRFDGEESWITNLEDFSIWYQTIFSPKANGLLNIAFCLVPDFKSPMKTVNRRVNFIPEIIFKIFQISGESKTKFRRANEVRHLPSGLLYWKLLTGKTSMFSLSQKVLL